MKKTRKERHLGLRVFGHGLLMVERQREERWEAATNRAVIMSVQSEGESDAERMQRLQ